MNKYQRRALLHRMLHKLTLNLSESLYTHIIIIIIIIVTNIALHALCAGCIGWSSVGHHHQHHHMIEGRSIHIHPYMYHLFFAVSFYLILFRLGFSVQSTANENKKNHREHTYTYHTYRKKKYISTLNPGKRELRELREPDGNSICENGSEVIACTTTIIIIITILIQ